MTHRELERIRNKDLSPRDRVNAIMEEEFNVKLLKAYKGDMIDLLVFANQHQTLIVSVSPTRADIYGFNESIELR